MKVPQTDLFFKYHFFIKIERIMWLYAEDIMLQRSGID